MHCAANLHNAATGVNFEEILNLSLQNAADKYHLLWRNEKIKDEPG